MKLILLAFLLVFSNSVQASCVILLHGLARTNSAMEPLENALKEEGFLPINEGYPSREYPIEQLAEIAIRPALEKCPKGEKVNFVTHSLGGILVRQYLSRHDVANLNRVVMLGPPNQGSEVVDELRDVPGFHFINGDAGMQLGTDELSIPNTLGKANFDVGIIAGTSSINWILSSLIPGTDDGKVSIESTKLDGMNDHIEMPVTHPFMMKNDRVIAQVVNYLKNGSFEHGDNP
ncbi:esterase/lipase family protein [Vreelandella alkaliphila]|uniref:Alpha/beta hydrolase n=1 Tax=Vreelandella alkaliphila TaxID=272774 RepID=A0AAJ2RZ39_9GAMM|nr:alpha/beta hydrolase [Halomonas alkaliphila]MDX5976868.1 alpha/beta hydrolase [Halomonas alkaliphila]